MNRASIFLFFSLSLFKACKDLEKPEPLLPSNDTKSEFLFYQTDCKAPCLVTFTNTSTGFDGFFMGASVLPKGSKFIVNI